MAMKFLTLVNRYPLEPYVGMFDGEEYRIEDKLLVLDTVARHLKIHSIIRDNPITGDNDYRLAILEDGDDVSPVESLPVETLDRSDMDNFRKVELRASGIKSARPEPRGSGRFDSLVVTKER